MQALELAGLEDVTEIHAVFQACGKAMLEVGIQQWDGTYPGVEHIRQDISGQEIYVLRQAGVVKATITLNEQQDEQYTNINWHIAGDKILVIHRLAVHPSLQGQGIGQQMCDFAERFALERGYAVIRLDAYSGNPVSTHMYEKLGYTRASGLCYFHGIQKPFYCYEKSLRS